VSENHEKRSRQEEKEEKKISVFFCFIEDNCEKEPRRQNKEREHDRRKTRTNELIDNDFPLSLTTK
jgi:hypothetical protein